MHESEIIELVTQKLEKALRGSEQETNQFDFKSRWNDLDDGKNVFQLLKHLTAIANTGLIDGFIVFGFDEKTKEFRDVSFSEDSGLADKGMLRDKIIKYVEPHFSTEYFERDILGYNIGILHIPPSNNKPHTLPKYFTFDKKGNKKLHRNKIFIRDNTNSVEASRGDLDQMYIERGFNVTKEPFEFSFELISYYLLKNYGNNYFKASILIENTGSRAFVLYGIKMKFTFLNNDYTLNNSINEEQEDNWPINSKRIIFKAGEIKEVSAYTNLSCKAHSFDIFPEMENLNKLEMILLFNDNRQNVYEIQYDLQEMKHTLANHREFKRDKESTGFYF